MAGLHFDITADNHVFVEALKKIQEDVKKTTSFISDAGKSMDFSSMENGIVSLTKKIEVNEAKIADYRKAVVTDMQAIEDALKMGDVVKADQFNEYLDSNLKKIEELTAETQNYKDLLSTISVFDSSGQTSQRVDAPMMFLSQEEFDRVKELHGEIERINQDIAETAAKGQDISGLKDELSDTKKELAEMEVKAMNTASEFGTVGRSASALITRVFELKDEIKSNIEENEKLVKSLEEVEEALENAKKAGDSEEVEKQRIKRDNLVESIRNNVAEYNNLTSELSEHKKSLEGMTERWNSLSSVLGKIPGPIGNVVRQITSLIGEAKNAVTAMEGLTAATEGTTAATAGLASATVAFIALPILAFLAAVAAAYEAVKVWMERTEEGQDALAIATAKYGQVLENLKDRVADVGEFIWTTFETVTQKVENFVGGLENLLGIVGTFTGQTLGRFIGGGFGETIGGAFGGWLGRDSAKNAEKAAALAKRQDDLDDKRRDFLVDEQKMLKEKDRLMREARDTSKSQAERDKAYNKLLKQTNAIYKNRIDMAKEERDIAKEKISLSKTPEQEKERVARLDAKVLELERQQINELRTLDRVRNSINNAGNNAANKAAQLLKQQQAYKALLDKQTLERERSVTDMEFATTQAQINAMKDGTKKTLAQIELDYKKQEEAIERASIDLQRKKIEMARQAWEKNPSNKGKAFDPSSVDTSETEIEKANKDALIKENEAKRLKSIETVQKAELQAMNDYLKAYGSMEQKRLAIRQEYEQKIRDAQTEGEKLSLEKELQQREASLSFEGIAKDIDWASLFGGIENMTDEMMKRMFEQLQAYQKTEGYAKADAGTKQQVADMLKQLRPFVGETDRQKLLEEMGRAVNSFNEAVIEYKETVEDEKQAREEYEKARLEEETAREARRKAEVELNAGKITQEEFDSIAPTIEEIEALGKQTKIAKDSFDGISSVSVRAKENVDRLGQEAKEAADAVSNMVSEGVQNMMKTASYKENIMGFKEMTDSLKNMDSFIDIIGKANKEGEYSGFAKEAATVLTDKIAPVMENVTSGVDSIMSSGVMQVAGMYAQYARLIMEAANMVKTYVTGVLDSYTELLKFDWLEDMVVSITDAISNLVNAIFDLPENLYKALEGIVTDGIGDMLSNTLGRVGNVLSLGALSSKGVSSWFSNEDKVTATINALTDRNERLQKAIEDLTDEMRSGTVAEKVEATNKAIEYQEEINRNELEKAMAQAGYHSAHHSFNYYWGGYSDEEIADLNKQFNREKGNEWNGDIWDLSPEEMKILRGNIELWDKIEETGKGGYGERVANVLEGYIEQAGKLEELRQELVEGLTGVTFDSLYDSFVDKLSDMDVKAEDFAEDFEGYMKNAIVKGLAAEQLKPLMTKWQQAFASFVESSGELSSAEVEMLKTKGGTFYNKNTGQYEEFQSWEELVKIGESINSTMKAYGWSSTSSDKQATANMAEKATYDQFELYLGIATAQQIALEQGNDVRTQILNTLQAMHEVSSPNGQAVNNIREQIVIANDHLFAIRNSNKDILKYMNESLTEKMDNMYDLIDERL